MINNIKIEICINNIDDAIKASKYPIDRIELNSAIELGGLTPTVETLKVLKGTIKPKICCMVRPRTGDFVYTDTEFEVMLRDAENLLKANADGIVFGFLNDDKTINIERTQIMSDLIHSYRKEAIFHKAFDEVEDQFASCADLIGCYIDRILTSGKAVYPDIIEGCERIRELKNTFNNQIQFLPGGGVRVDNIQDVIRTSSCSQIHMTSKKQYPGGYLGLDEKQLEEMLEKISSM